MAAPKVQAVLAEPKKEKKKSKIQQALEQAAEDHKREMTRRRIELARSGVRSYYTRRFSDAVKAFQMYLKILENWKNVPEGKLNPSYFDVKKDQAELLLITGVYWDLVKLYDHTRTKNREREFSHYLDQYIIFSKNMPHQALCAETLRKYISNKEPVHLEEFKRAYQVIQVTSRCFVATSLLDVSDPETLGRLRGFRDRVLKRNVYGRGFVAWYYRRGPGLASLVEKMPWIVRRGLGLGLDTIGWFLRQR